MTSNQVSPEELGQIDVFGCLSREQVNALAILAYSHFENGRFDQARAMYETLSTLDSKEPAYPAGAAVAWFSAPGRQFALFAAESVAEVKKVVWPTRKETMQTTAAVFAFVVVMVTFVAYLLNTWALRWVNPSVVGMFIYMQPILATAMSMMVWHSGLPNAAATAPSASLCGNGAILS